MRQLISREHIARRCRRWQLVGRPRLVHPRPHRLPWAEPDRSAAPPEAPTAAVALPLPPWPGFPRTIWLHEQLLPALEESHRRLIS